MSDDDDKPTSDEPSKAPIKLNVAAEGTQHKVERMAGGRFMAYCGDVLYMNMVASSDSTHLMMRSLFWHVVMSPVE